MGAPRSQYQRVAEWTIAQSGLLSLLERLSARESRSLPILLLHRIDDPSACGDLRAPDLISAIPEVFAAEMEFLARNFHPIGISDLLGALDGAPLPRRAVLVTFDDGTADFKEHAWPVLKRLGVPSVLCVPTGLIGEQGALFWEDRLHQALARTHSTRVALEGLGVLELGTPNLRRRAEVSIRDYLHGFAGSAPEDIVERLERQLGVTPQPFKSLLSWDDLRSLGDSVGVVPHGYRHLRLAGMSAEALRAEVERPFADIRAELGYCPPVFSYPFGQFDARVTAAVEAAGYVAAFSTRAGFAELTPGERFRLRRVHIYHGTLAHFRLDLTRPFAWYLARREDLTSVPDDGLAAASTGSPER
jgi:peptidoglycan/xylan/chitin deacetylase (PgdA/CDA1 family)